MTGDRWVDSAGNRWDESHEIWWIFSASTEEWGGLRIAHFREIAGGVVIVAINGEVDQRRLGPRIWKDIAPREGWRKVKQILPPTAAEVEAALARSAFSA